MRNLKAYSVRNPAFVPFGSDNGITIITYEGMSKSNACILARLPTILKLGKISPNKNQKVPIMGKK